MQQGMRDVCIVGGGPVGLSAALTLARQGRSVTLLEARDLGYVEPDAMDARSIALSLSSQRIFESLDLWDDLRPNCAPIRHIHVSSAGHLGMTRLHADELGLEAMGQVVEYHLLQQTLLIEAEREPAIELCFPARIESLQMQDSGPVIEFRSEQEEDLQCREGRLLLLADGGQSDLAARLGLQRESRDYGQTAIVANLRFDRAGDGWAWERFAARGPMALLPLVRDRYALVWSLPPQQAEALIEAGETDFIEALHQQFGYRLGRVREVGRRAAFPLVLRRTRPLSGSRWALLGNAANVLHPVAGQGFNLALRDVSTLYDVLEGCSLDGDPGEALQRYARRREPDQQRTLAWGNRLVELFGNDLPILDHGRAAALGLLERCPALKCEVAWQGMGYGSDLSSLMRGRP